MGLQWYPGEPKVEVDGEILDCYCLIPYKHKNDFGSYDFTVYTRKGAKTDVHYVEDYATVQFEEDKELGQGEVRVACSVSEVPAETEALLRVFAPFDDQYVFASGTAGHVSVLLHLTRGVQ